MDADYNFFKTLGAGTREAAKSPRPLVRPLNQCPKIKIARARQLSRSNLLFRRMILSQKVCTFWDHALAILKRIVDENCIQPFRTCRKKRDRCLDQFLDAAHIFDRLRREVGPRSCTRRRALPPFDRLIDGLYARLRRLLAGR